MSTALAPVENGQEHGLDLSGYDPQAYNILSPVLRLDTAAPYLRFRAVEVRLDPDVHRGDCYAAPGAKWVRERGVSVPTLVAPSKPGLLKIASAAGLVIDPVNSHRIKPDACERCIDMARSTGQAVRCGDCASRYDVAYQHIGAVRSDTGWRIVKASYEWNLDAQRRKLVREAKKRLAKAQQEGRPFDLEEYVEDRLDQIIAERFGLAETKSLLRLVRAICHLRQAYTREEMGRPFVVVRAELAPDYADPEVRRALAERALASGAEIFGPAREAGAAAALAPPVEPEVIEELSALPDFTEAEERAEAATEAASEEVEIPDVGDPGPEAVAEEVAAPPVPDDPEPEREPPAARCDDCGAGLTQAVVAYCQSARGQATFGGASYCYGCQKKHRPARVRKAVAR